ncbi:MAG: hypothetical protein JSS86_04620 [Cyanobacteria bacterium SZAS LIN-2]|nr:hypothetical protein [Cyanobacteria bacterium SZAS LIN-2]
MNVKIFALSLLLVGVLPALPSYAARPGVEDGGARFDFEKNSWGAPKKEKKPFVPTSVTPGAVNMKKMVDPAMFAAPVSRPAQPVIQMQVQPVIQVPRVQAEQFSNEFGAPIPQEVAAPQPIQPSPAVTPARMNMPAAPPARSIPPSVVTGVNARLRPKRTYDLVARPAPLPIIEVYKPGSGFAPGGAGAGGASVMAHTTVKAEIVHKSN